ncbi:hypothetical protein HDU92_009153 [Lobulomyces angularis]|nr:hypothetical protein HDU92_009153 [Lobulomyces angularis]
MKNNYDTFSDSSTKSLKIATDADATLNQNSQSTILTYDGSDSGYSEHDNLLIDDIENCASKHRPHQGTSEYYHSILNSINTLMGMGILSLPYAFSSGGWISSVCFLVLSAFTCNFTSKLLACCFEYGIKLKFKSKNIEEKNLPVTYAEVGELAFGKFGRAFISFMFVLELGAASSAILIVVADSLNALIPQINITLTKIVIVVLLTPSTLINLRFLMYSSILGILACVNVCGIIVVEGAISTETPGSWLHPVETALYPSSFLGVGLSMGLILVGFDAHSVYPSIYRDLKDKTTFPAVMDRAYLFNSILYLVIGSCGYLMFGDLTMPEITQNLPNVKSYVPALTTFTLILIVTNSLTKFPLLTSPLLTYVEQLSTNNSPQKKAFVAVFLNAVILLTSILIPSFHKVMGLLGSGFSIVVAVIFPSLCYYKLFYIDNNFLKEENDINNNSYGVFFKKILILILIIGGIFCGIIGVSGTLLSKH